MFKYSSARAAGRGVTMRIWAARRFTCCRLSGGVTGEIHFVDSGYNIVSMPQPDFAAQRG